MTTQRHPSRTQGSRSAVNRPVAATTWPVEIAIREPDAEHACSTATARLLTRDKTVLEGKGLAECRSRNADVVEISRSMAAARALSDLAHQLFEVAATHEAMTCTHGHELDGPGAGRRM
ncbi:DUF1876 domain-containing protein [Rhodococcus opacus]|nr:DUF1876 domain-containing protein [Rhodococcus opacus]